MKPVFGDTVNFLALVNGADTFHRQAVQLSREPPGPLVTTEWVLTEVGDALSQAPNRPRFNRLLLLLRSQKDVEIVPSSSDIFQRGCQLYAEREDNDWPLTDCGSFVVMNERGVSQALTSDHDPQEDG